MASRYTFSIRRSARRASVARSVASSWFAPTSSIAWHKR